MKLNYIKIRQGSLNLYVFKLSIKELIDKSIIEHFDSSDETGYQRPPKPSHYKKISKYLMKSSKAILPTAILAAIESENVSEEGSLLVINNKFRIVDGQHRIEGIKYLENGDDDAKRRYQYILENYEFPIILMVNDRNDKIVEIDTFININSKGLKVSTNLAKMLSEKIHSEEILADNNIIKTITPQLITDTATKIAQILGKDKASTWFDLITFGDDLTYSKPISINAFSKAISEIVSIELNKNGQEISKEQLLKEIELISKFLNIAWEKVMKRWHECFKDFSANGYNIRKGIGVYSLYGVLRDIFIVTKSIEDAIRIFEETLFESKVKSSDWIVGGTFTGMTSGQAIKKIIQIIKNEVIKTEV